MKHILQIITEDPEAKPVFSADIGERIPLDIALVVLTAIKSVPELTAKERKARSDKGTTRPKAQPVA